MSYILELKEENFSKIESSINGLPHFLVIKNILIGTSPGKIWVDDKRNPSTGIIWDMTNTFFFLFGNDKNLRDELELSSLLINEIIQVAKKHHYNNFFLIPLSKSWQTNLDNILETVRLQTRIMLTFWLDPLKEQQISTKNLQIPYNFTLARIDHQNLSHDDFKNKEEIEYCIRACWRSFDRYYREGVGFFLFTDKTIISWCSTDYIVENRCELYVETFKDYQKKGYGTIVATACLEKCLKNQLQPYWHCWENNSGSVKLAEKLGLEKQKESIVYWKTL